MLSTSDYYAFGGPMPGRKYNSNLMRYGFNGKENDDEVKGSGNSLDFGARVYDPRLGKFLSVDPDVEKYPFMSPYCFAANSPIVLIDEEGRGPKPPQVRGGYRPVIRSANWLETQNSINRSNANRGPKPRAWQPTPSSLGAFGIMNTGETWSGEVNSKFPTRGTVGNPGMSVGTYNAPEAMQLVGKALENSKEYFEKTKVVAFADYNQNTGANYSEITVTEVFVKIPSEVQTLQNSYQSSLKASAQGKLSDAEFNKLPIAEQTSRYSSAKLILGQSPKDKYIELVKKEYNSGGTSSSGTNTSTTTNSSGTSNSSTELKAATTYR